MTAMNITILCESTNISRLSSLRSIVTFVIVIIARIEPSLGIGIKDGRNERRHETFPHFESTQRFGREGESTAGLSSYLAINDNIIRTMKGSRSQPTAEGRKGTSRLFFDHCERRPRTLLLILSSNREPEVNTFSL